MSAAVDAVKDHVELPWLVSDKTTSSEESSAKPEGLVEEPKSTEEAPVAAEQTESTTEALPEQPSPEAILAEEKPAATVTRILSQRHFTKALKEITPSSSEATGTLSALRKWNEEFGEGRRERKRKQIWGKGRFGFSDPANFTEEDGRVLPSTSAAEPSAP